MRYLMFFMTLLTLTGCISEDHKSKVYTNKIEFFQPKVQKILYAGTERKKLPYEYYKINFPDTEIAENKLNIHILRRLNKHNKAFIPVAQKELKMVQEFTADLKVEISEIDNQHKQLEELKKQIKESSQHF